MIQKCCINSWTMLYGKTMENVKNRIDKRFISNEKDYLKWTSKPSYMSQRICDNDYLKWSLY